jgi:hypothetical protein
VMDSPVLDVEGQFPAVDRARSITTSGRSRLAP